MSTAETWAARVGVPGSLIPDAGPSDVEELPGGRNYELLTSSLRHFLDDFAGALPDDATALELAGELQRWSFLLADCQASEQDQAFGRRADLPGRGQTMAPAFVTTSRHRDAVEGHVTFGRNYLGGNGAVHGGAIALLFDEVLGRFSDTDGRPAARTAYLNTTYRSLTPIDRRLHLRAWFENETGRERLLRGELRDGTRLCAEAEGLFITPEPGQH